MQFTVSKGLGEILFNSIRQVSLCKLDVVRPIAYSVGSSSTVLSAGNAVEEDMIQIGSSITSVSFETTSNSELIIKEYSCDGVFTTNDLNDNDISVLGENTDILHSLFPITLKVYYRVAKGEQSKENNIVFLENNDIDTKTCTVINSRHCNVDRFAIKKSDDYNKEIIEVIIDNSDSLSESEILKKSISLMIEELYFIEQSL